MTPARQIRIIRFLVEMSAVQFAQEIGFKASSVCEWEHGRTTPGPKAWARIMDLCRQREIGFLPSGMPVPMSDLMSMTQWVRPAEQEQTPVRHLRPRFRSESRSAAHA